MTQGVIVLDRQMKHRRDNAKQPVPAVAKSIPQLMTDPQVLEASNAAIT